MNIGTKQILSFSLAISLFAWASPATLALSDKALGKKKTAELINEITQGNFDKVKALIEGHSSDDNPTIMRSVEAINDTVNQTKNENDQSLMDLALLQCNNISKAPEYEKIIKYLIESKADVNALDVHGNTPLHRAVKMGSISLVTLFLKHDANQSICNKNKKLAYDLAEDELKGSEKGNIQKLLVDAANKKNLPPVDNKKRYIIGGSVVVASVMMSLLVYYWRNAVLKKKQSQVIALINQVKNGEITQAQFDAAYQEIKDGLLSWEAQALNKLSELQQII